MFKRKIPNDGILRLIPKQKKGIFKLIFSRLFMILVLISIQILIIGSLYIRMNEATPYFKVFFNLLTAVTIIWLFNCEMDSTAKLTWMIIFFISPVPGTILFVLTQTDFGHYAIKKRVESIISETKNIIPQNEEVMADVQLTCSGTDDLCRYVNRTGCFPIYTNTETNFLASGEEKFSAVLEELDKAEKFIFMEYFIIDEGYMWGKILEKLRDKAAQGVEVRVMYDGMCEMSTLTHDYPKRMANLGIKCRGFAPITPFLSTYYNYRDHRKILVIDGKTAFTGGINFADEYINRRERFGHWKDSAVMLKGEAVRSFTLMFLQMWNISEKEPEWDKWLEPVKSTNCGGFVMPYADCPLDDYRVGENVYIDILNRATSYVHIMTPYLIIDGELENALKYAAQRGIDVKIILPGIPDKKMAFALAKTHYKELTKAGVKLYEYTPGFVHSKIFVSDDEKAVVGTINLDYRSLYHHFECAAYMYRTSCISEIEADFSATLEKCREVTLETIKKEKIFYKISGQILKFVAPLF
ncbi:MAG: cardiolipin synthase [Ruminococcus sp.]|nr:cardiolipin synthase [Ruminococcus sp.]